MCCSKFLTWNYNNSKYMVIVHCLLNKVYFRCVNHACYSYYTYISPTNAVAWVHCTFSSHTHLGYNVKKDEQHNLFGLWIDLDRKKKNLLQKERSTHFFLLCPLFLSNIYIYKHVFFSNTKKNLFENRLLSKCFIWASEGRKETKICYQIFTWKKNCCIFHQTSRIENAY